MRPIEMVDLKSQYIKIKSEIDKKIADVIDSASFINGDTVKEFQHNLAAYLGVKHAIPCGNGTDALQIAMMTLGLQPGDEVITTPFTFIATAESMALLGLTPIFVDVERDTFNINVSQVEAAITPRTKAIVPVHLFGQSCNMEAIMTIAKKHSLYVIEDACQSIGSTVVFSHGEIKKTGTIGDMGCTSFFPSKNLGGYGDGGAIFTNNDELAVRAKSIANHGMSTRYYHERIGINSRLDSLQAAILSVKLKCLDQYIVARQKAAAYYTHALEQCNAIETPVVKPFATHVFHQYTLKLAGGIDRQKIMDAMKKQNIPVAIYYPMPLHLQKVFAHLPQCKEGLFPVAESLSQCVISLPMHTELDKEQLIYIAESLLNAVIMNV